LNFFPKVKMFPLSFLPPCKVWKFFESGMVKFSILEINALESIGKSLEIGKVLSSPGPIEQYRAPALNGLSPARLESGQAHWPNHRRSRAQTARTPQSGHAHSSRCHAHVHRFPCPYVTPTFYKNKFFCPHRSAYKMHINL
jgi:hypothetical protein